MCFISSLCQKFRLMIAKPWYTLTPVGRNTLSTMVKNICTDAGVGGNKTNHSLRATGTTALFTDGVPEKVIQQRSGHLSLQGMRRSPVNSNKPLIECCLLVKILPLVQNWKNLPLPTWNQSYQNLQLACLHLRHECTFQAVLSIYIKGKSRCRKLDTDLSAGMHCVNIYLLSFCIKGKTSWTLTSQPACIVYYLLIVFLYILSWHAITT